MYTQCPNCEAIFHLQHAQLRAADGHVRCSQCQHTFNAAKQRIEKLPDEHDLDVAEKALAQTSEQRSRGGWVLKFLLALLLTTTLLLQYYGYTQTDNLLQHPTLRPWLDKVCTYIPDCHLPLTRNLSAFKTEKHNLAPHATDANAVTLHLVFSNQAIFPQAYPRLDIKIEDENRQLIALQHLMPADYLPADFVMAQMGAGEQRHLKLDFISVVPNMHSYGYQIDYQ